MKIAQSAAQLYSFRDHIKTVAGFRQTLGRLRELGYRAVQLSGSIAPMPVEELRRVLDGEGFAAPTSHESGEALVSDTARIADKLNALKCPHVAYPFPHFPLTDLAAVRRLAAELEQTARLLRVEGIRLAYHNHDIEFARLGGRMILEVLYEEAPSLQAELDTYWVQAGGGSPLDWVRRMAGRMEVLHLKDYGMAGARECGCRVMLPVGSGNLDWEALVPAASEGGVKTFVVEHDGNCEDPFESFRASLEFLSTRFVRREPVGAARA